MRWDNGNTTIGSRYFARSGRKEDRVYRLHRDNTSIAYYDKICKEDECCWRTLAKYSFNPQRLDWTKH